MNFQRTLLTAAVLILAVSNILPRDFTVIRPVFRLEREPLVRIGLLTNTTSVLISTRGGSLVSSTAREPRTDLGTARVRISSRPYKPPVYELFRFELNTPDSRPEAERLARTVRIKAGEPAEVRHASEAGDFKVVIGREVDSRAEADEYLAKLAEKGVENAEIVSERFTSPSDEAVALTVRIIRNPRSQVRSLGLSRTANRKPARRRIRTIASSAPTWKKNFNARIDPSIREVTVSGSSPASRFSSLEAITIETKTPRGIVRLNGRSYRGKMEVFVNGKGRISVVNVVPLEDYLLGVVPAELSLPQIEAQKAQAVAARTYAVANRDGFGRQGFDMLATIWSQVYKGVAIESRMGTRAVRETRGIVATYRNQPINALYTSTCGGRTEDSGNIFDFNEPYLRGVDCSLDLDEYFTPFLIKTSREPALIRNEANYALVRLASRYAVNNFLMVTPRFDDDYFEDPPTELELRSWLNRIAARLGRPYPRVGPDSSKPIPLARTLYGLLYTRNSEDADTLMSKADVGYQLSFLDASEIPSTDRPMLAELMRDGWFSIYSDLTIKPNKRYSRGKILRLVDEIYKKKRWDLAFKRGTAKPTADGKLILKAGRSEKEVVVNAHVFLFRKFGNAYYQVRETVLIGGESVRYKTNAAGEVVYLEVAPTARTTVAERMSPFTTWRRNLSASTVRARLSRYVKGMGALIDVNIKKKGFSRRATELEIITTKGVQILKGGRIRSALKLREQLFVMNKRYGSTGRVVSFTFTGRGWGHGVGMCQYGAYGFAKMGLKYDRIIKHYYTGVDLTKAY